MDVVLALTLFVIALTLWTFIPDGIRAAIRGAAGPAWAAVWGAVCALARLAYRGLCFIFDVPVELPSVKRSLPENAPAARQKAPDARTDGRTDLTDVPDLGCRRLQLDRTREALLHTLLYNGWTVTDVRAVLKGENAKIAAEVAAAEAQLAGPRYRRSPEEAQAIAERRQELGLQ
jgi:hypothetical protein